MDGETAPYKVASEMDVELFRAALRAKGLSPEACAAEIGVGRNTPRRWMNGVQPIVGKAQQLATLLDLSVDELWPTKRAA